MNEFFQTPIEFLKGVGPERGAILRSEAGIHTFWDLLNYFPFRFVDRSVYHSIADIPMIQGNVQLKGVIKSMAESGHGRSKHFKAVFQDQTGQIELVWFKGAKWIKNSIHTGKLYRVYGKAGRYGAS
jgi:ATP-dependent DNA helicase RecG